MPNAKIKLDRNALFQPIKEEDALKKMEADLINRANLSFNHQLNQEFPKKCVSDFKKSLQELQDIDATIATSFAVATTTLWFIPMQMVSLAASLLCMRNICLRTQAVEKQQHALKNLLMCWDWAMNSEGSIKLWRQIKNEVETAERNGTVYHNDILDMLETLYPFVSEDDFKAITADEIEQELIKIGDKSKDHITFKNYKVDRKQVELLHDIYGYQQEASLMTFLKSLLYAFPSAMTNAYNGIVNLYNTMNTANEMTPSVANPS